LYNINSLTKNYRNSQEVVILNVCSRPFKVTQGQNGQQRDGLSKDNLYASVKQRLVVFMR